MIGDYNYFAITAGPRRLAERFAHREAVRNFDRLRPKESSHDDALVLMPYPRQRALAGNEEISQVGPGLALSFRNRPSASEVSRSQMIATRHPIRSSSFNYMVPAEGLEPPTP